jgi:hypothetical protein
VQEPVCRIRHARGWRVLTLSCLLHCLVCFPVSLSLSFQPR